MSKNLKNVMSVITLTLVMLLSFNVNAQKKETGPIIFDPGNATQLELPSDLKGIVKPVRIIIPNFTHKLSNVDVSDDYDEATKYAVDFYKSIELKIKPSKLDIKNYNNILESGSKDVKFKLVEPLILKSTSTNEFLLNLEKIKPQLLQMDGGFKYYVKLNYTVQIIKSISQENDSSSAKVQGCLHAVLTGAAAGGVIGSWFPGIGTTIGAVVGIGVAMWDAC